MSELTREQVEYICKFLVEEHLSKDASTILAHDAAIHATIEQQAQELERVKFELGLRNEWAGLHADDVIRLKQQLAASQQEIKRLKEGALAWKAVAEDKGRELGEAEARCREMAQPRFVIADSAVVDYLENEVEQLWPMLGVESAFVTDLSHVGDFPDEQLGPEKYIWQAAIDLLRNQLAQIQATLAAREARIDGLEKELQEYRSIAERVGASNAVSERDAAVQEVGRLQERMRLIETGGSGPEEAQQARGSSGGDANH